MSEVINPNDVEKEVNKLPVPGAKLFLKAAGRLLTKKRPDQFGTINAKLDSIETMVNNTFNIVVGALAYNNLTTKANEINTKIDSINDLLDNKPVGYLRQMNEQAKQLSELVDSQIRFGETALDAFQGATKTDDLEPFTAYIGSFLHIIRLVERAVSGAQFTFSSVLDEMTEQKYDTEVVKDKSSKRLSQFSVFITKTVPEHYPDWCRGIFTGEEGYFYNLKYHGHMLSAFPSWSSEEVLPASSNYAPLAMFIMMELQYKEEETDDRYDLSCDRLWNISSTDTDTQNHEKWFCLSTPFASAPFVYVRNPDDGLFTRCYDFPLLRQDETLIIGYPLDEGQGLAATSEGGSKIHKLDPHNVDTAMQWTMKPT